MHWPINILNLKAKGGRRVREGEVSQNIWLLLFLEQNLKEKGGVVVHHHEDRGKRVKADVVVDGVEREKAK